MREARRDGGQRGGPEVSVARAVTGRPGSAYRVRAACLVRSDPSGGVGSNPSAGRTRI